MPSKTPYASASKAPHASASKAPHASAEPLCLYDVCNDYSLSVAESQKLPCPDTYRTIKKKHRTLYYHRAYCELHYLLGKPGLEGIIVSA